MLIIGIDYSITSPALCIFEGAAKSFSFEHCTFYSLSQYKDILHRHDNVHYHTHLPFEDQIDRFDNISNWAIGIIQEYDANDVDLIGIEGYAMGAKGKVFNIGENTGILKHKLYVNGYIYDTVAPTVVKKFATGKGSGKKDKMYEQFVQETGVDLKKFIQPNRLLGSPTTDLVDAFYICKYFVAENSNK